MGTCEPVLKITQLDTALVKNSFKYQIWKYFVPLPGILFLACLSDICECVHDQVC